MVFVSLASKCVSLGPLKAIFNRLLLITPNPASNAACHPNYIPQTLPNFYSQKLLIWIFSQKKELPTKLPLKDLTICNWTSKIPL